MSSIGPQLPPELARKRERDSDETDRSPKRLRTGSQLPSQGPRTDEISLDEDTSSADDTRKTYGPAAPGPRPSNNAEIALDVSESDDEPRPASATTTQKTLSPSSASIGPSIGPALPSRNASPRAPIGPAAGPSRPPLDDTDDDNNKNNDDNDAVSDTDSDYGPALPSASRPAPPPANAAPQKQTAPQRDAWMLAPPTASAYRGPDPTKLRSRKFNAGRAASSATGATSEVDSIWTETVEQKRKRLEDAVLGRSGGGGGSTTTNGSLAPKPGAQSAASVAARDDPIARARGTKSLYEQHQTRRRDAGKRDDEDDPSKRAFDKEKDMALGGRISSTQRRDLLQRSSDFSSRFSRGSL